MCNSIIKFDRGYRKYRCHCRTLFVAARENQFPEVLSYVNVRRVTPIPCIIFTVSLQSKPYGEIDHKNIEYHYVGSNLFAMLLVLTRIIHVHNYYLCVFVMLFDVLRGFGLNLFYLIDDFTKRSTLNLLAMLLVVLKDHIFIFFAMLFVILWDLVLIF